MHAADYPGSHVVIRNPIDRRSLRDAVEAAQPRRFTARGIAGQAAVHYTQKKFVNKPKGAVRLVSLASFKTCSRTKVLSVSNC